LMGICYAAYTRIVGGGWDKRLSQSVQNHASCSTSEILSRAT
jgi:hypothetical protein